MNRYGSIILAGFVALAASGCKLSFLNSVGVNQLVNAVSSLNSQEIISLATNLLSNTNVQAAVNSILTNETLIASLTNYWPSVSNLYAIGGLTSTTSGTSTVSTTTIFSTNLPTIGGGETIAGYGPVNYLWNMDDDVIVAGLTYMQEHNVRWINWEFVGNASEDVLSDTGKLARAESRFLLIQSECKARGIWCAPILLNDNAGDGSYQNAGVKLSERLTQAKALIDFVAANADPSVCSITAVSEIQTSAGEQLESYALAKFSVAGIRQDYNGSSRPTSIPSSYTGIRVWHVCNIDSWPDFNTVWMNDCGTAIRSVGINSGDAIRSMSVDGTLYGLGDFNVISNYKQTAISKGQYVFARYGFQDTVFDTNAIRALSMPGGYTVITNSAETSNTTVSADVGPWGNDLSSVTFLGVDVSKWPITTPLTAEITDTKVIYGDFDKADTWTAVDGSIGNPWVIAKINGKWYADNWEWIPKGRPWNLKNGLNAGAFHHAPMNSYNPTNGETMGMLVSGLARGTKRNVSERSNVSVVEWK